MNSARALEILREKFPQAEIREVEGNPNVMGWYLFVLEDEWVDPVFVDSEGNILNANREAWR